MTEPSLTQKSVISSLISPLITQSGCYLEEVTISGGNPKLVTVVVDSDTNLNLDQITSITKSISSAIEESTELGDSPFTLEVTTPGIDRPLTETRHWLKNQGRLVKVDFADGTSKTGRVGQVGDASVDIDGAPIDRSTIKSAIVQIEFNPPKNVEKDAR